MSVVSEEKPSEILGGLPNRRPQRRSEKRSGGSPAPNGRSAGDRKRPAGASKAKQPNARRRARPEPLRQPKQPAGTPPKPPSRRPAPPSGPQIITTVVQAAGELVEIGLSASARTVRDALSRLPRP
jgi:hypothetical protein